MKQIKITYSKGTGFDPFFNNIKQIDVDDAPFAGGGFGDIYHARGFNGGRQPKLRQVIKVFKQSSVGKEEHSWKTITRLQDKLIEEMALCSESGEDFLYQYPALIAMPQFVFEGTFDGRKVMGYSTSNLNELGYVSFEDVIDKEDSPYMEEFENKNMEWRYTMAYHLVRGFNLLYKMHFLHADISSDNIFVNLNQPLCAILDFDSGSIVETIEDNPSTYGKEQPWLAPEIRFQLKKGNTADGNTLVSINSFTDAWSVTNALLNILLLTPAYFLADMSENSLRSYVNKYNWPDAKFTDALFIAENEDYYNYFYQLFSQVLPIEVQNEFIATFGKGIFKPSLRTSYNRWERILKNQIPKSAWRISIPNVETIPVRISPPNLGSGSGSGKIDNPPVTYSESKKELEEYVNALVVDVVHGDENLKRHTHFLNDMAKKAGLDGKKVQEELKDFIDLFQDCTEDGVITKFEMSNLLAQAELALVSKETVDKILKPYKVK